MCDQVVRLPSTCGGTNDACLWNLRLWKWSLWSRWTIICCWNDALTSFCDFKLTTSHLQQIHVSSNGTLANFQCCQWILHTFSLPVVAVAVKTGTKSVYNQALEVKYWPKDIRLTRLMMWIISLTRVNRWICFESKQAWVTMGYYHATLADW